MEGLMGKDDFIKDPQYFPFIMKFVIIGDRQVGKSCLRLQFTKKRYRAIWQPTKGVAFGAKSVVLGGGMEARIQCWDTSGADQFRLIVQGCLDDHCKAVLIVYDVTRRGSFEHVAHWLQEVCENAPHVPKRCVTLVGNKCDKALERQVPCEEGFEFAQRHGLHFVEASAATGAMVDETFMITTSSILNSWLSEVANAYPDVESWLSQIIATQSQLQTIERYHQAGWYNAAGSPSQLTGDSQTFQDRRFAEQLQASEESNRGSVLLRVSRRNGRLRIGIDESVLSLVCEPLHDLIIKRALKGLGHLARYAVLSWALRGI